MQAGLKKFIASILMALVFMPYFFVAHQAYAVDGDLTGSGIYGNQGLVRAGAAGLGSALATCVSAPLIGKLASYFTDADSVKINQDVDKAQYLKTCFDAIAAGAAKVLLKHLTISTVNWINSGFQGDPLFVQNPGSFFKSIADQETNQFITAIGYDPNIFPFGRLTAQNLHSYLTGYFERNAQYSMDKYLYDGATFVEYNNNFNLGGWDAYIHLAEPSNNPIGFQIVAQDTLAKRVAGGVINKIEEVKSELNQGSGFLSLKACADPSDFTTNPKYKNWDRGAAIANLSTASNELYQARKTGNLDAMNEAEQKVNEAQQEINDNTCKRYQTATPGKVISDQLSITLGSTTRQLELANDLNSSLTAIFDALINQLVNQGLSSLTQKDDRSDLGTEEFTKYEFGGYGTNNGEVVLNPNGGWLGAGDQYIFVIKRDLPKILLRHETYKGELVKELDYLQSLVSNIYQLDYCVPGPNPSWETLTQPKLEEIQAEVIALNSENPGEEVSVNKELLRQYTNLVARTNTSDDTAKINTAQKLNSILSRILEKYKPIIQVNFSSGKLPQSASLNKAEFTKIPTYQEQIVQANNELNTIDLLIQKIRILNDQVQSATTQNQLDSLTETYYSYLEEMIQQNTLTRLQQNNTLLNQKISQVQVSTDRCENDLSENQNLAQERIEYPSDLKRPDGAKDFPSQKSFLLGYTYGNGQGTTIGITDLVNIDINSDLSTFEKVFNIY